MGMRTNPYYMSEEQRRPLPPQQQKRLYDDVPLAEENAGAMLKENIRDNRDIELRQKEQRAATEQENIKEEGRERGRMITGMSEGYQTGRNNAVARKLSEEQIRGKQFENRMNEGYGQQEREAGLDLTRANVTTAKAQAQYAGRREAAGVRGAEAGATVAEVDANYAEPKAKQQQELGDLLVNEKKYQVEFAKADAKTKAAESAFQDSPATDAQLAGAKPGETIRAWTLRTDAEMKGTDSQHKSAQLAFQKEQLKQIIDHSPLQKSLLAAQIQGARVSNEATALSNVNAKLDNTTKYKQVRLADISTMLRSNDPRAAAKLKGYEPEEIAEAMHKNKMNDQQSAFIANEIKKQDPEHAFAIEQKMEALRQASAYKNIIGDLKVMQTSYKSAAGKTWDSDLAMGDRNRIARYFKDAGHPELAEKVLKGWKAQDPMSVNTTIEEGIQRIREEANKRLIDHAGMPSVASALNGIGLTPYRNNDGSTGVHDTDKFNLFPPPNSSTQPPQPPAGTPLPQFIQAQGQGYQPGLGAPAPAPAPRKTMRPAASVGR